MLSADIWMRQANHPWSYRQVMGSPRTAHTSGAEHHRGKTPRSDERRTISDDRCDGARERFHSRAVSMESPTPIVWMARSLRRRRVDRAATSCPSSIARSQSVIDPSVGPSSSSITCIRPRCLLPRARRRLPHPSQPHPRTILKWIPSARRTSCARAASSSSVWPTMLTTHSIAF